jgi:hypothetical protein
MFERGRGGDKADQGPVAVAITLEDGREFRGKVHLPVGFGLTDVLNGPNSFIDFVTLDGERMYFAKSALQSVAPANVPAAVDLWAGPTEGGDFDPFTVLGVKAGSTREQAHEAYLRLAKLYHPDRYATAELPPEVRNYLSVMSRRVNAAYHALEAEKKKQANRSEPVFTKAGN